MNFFSCLFFFFYLKTYFILHPPPRLPDISHFWRQPDLLCFVAWGMGVGGQFSAFSQGDRGSVLVELVNLPQDGGQHLTPLAGSGGCGLWAAHNIPGDPGPTDNGQQPPSPPPLLRTREGGQEAYRDPEHLPQSRAARRGQRTR